MIDVLDAEPGELGKALNNVGAVSPVSPTADELENATLHILSQTVEDYKKQEMKILELEQQIMLSESRKLDDETKSDTLGLNVTDQIRDTEEELQQERKSYQDILRQEYDEKLVDSERHLESIVNNYLTRENDRRLSAVQISRDVQKICQNLTTTGAPTTGDGRDAGRDGSAAASSGRAAGPGTTAIQHATFNALLALTPAKAEEIQREISR